MSIEVKDASDAIRVVATMVKDANGTCMKVSRVSGGITNQLYCVSYDRPADSRDETDGIDKHTRILVRVFGAEGMIDREKENATFRFLSSQGIAPKYLGSFKNGRLEAWLDGFKPLTLTDMSDENTSDAIARSLARLHAVHIPSDLKRYYADGVGMWKQLELWIKQALEHDPRVSDSRVRSKARMEAYERIDFSRMEKEIRSTRRQIETLGTSQVVFCHNDVLYGNIMKNAKGDIHLIDFEYGGMNYASFDIANHFNEWAGGTGTEKHGPGYHGHPDYDRLPNSAQRRHFCRAYMDELHRSSIADPDAPTKSIATGDDEITSRDVDALLDDVRRFSVVNHFYWGLWGVNQAFGEGCEEFDYMAYATKRIERGWKELRSQSVD